MARQTASWPLACATAAVSSLALAACAGDGVPPTSGTSSALTATMDVVWSNVVNATATGSTLSKTGGQPQMEDAGGTSQQEISAGDGFLVFTMSEAATFRWLGFGHSHAWSGAAELDFEFRLQAGRADVYERGGWRADNLAVAGDMLKIEVSGGIVRYYKNGTLLYTSSGAVTYPLVADASLIDPNATIQNASLAIAAGGAPGGAPDGSAPDIAVADIGVKDIGAGNVSAQDIGVGAIGTPDIGGIGDALGAPSPRHHFCGWLAGDGSSGPATQDRIFDWFAANAALFDAVHPTWWYVKGTGQSNCCTTAGIFCTSYGNPASGNWACQSSQIVPNTTPGRKPTKLIPAFSNDPTTASIVDSMLRDQTTMNRWISEIVSDAQQYHYDGVDIDFEHVDPKLRPQFTTFVTQLSQQMQALGKTVELDIDGPTNAAADASTHWDIASLAKVADRLHIMGYDYHYVGGPHPGPVDPLGWAQAVMAYVSQLNSGATKEKFIWALPNYGIAGPDGQTVPSLPPQQQGLKWWLAQFPAGYSTTTTEMDYCPFNVDSHYAAGRAPNGYMQYGHAYFDDITSLEEKVSAAQQAGLGGVSYWNIGDEPDQPPGRTFFQMIRAHFPQ